MMPRPLAAHEAALIAGLLRQARQPYAVPPLVRDLADGGMGSLAFHHEPPLVVSDMKIIAEHWFTDADGVPVLLTLYGNDAVLLELDIWKADFSPVLPFPKDLQF